MPKREQDSVAAERLFQEIEGSGACCFHGIGNRPMSGDHDDGSLRVICLEMTEEVDSAPVGKPHIDEISIRALGMHFRFSNRPAESHGIAFALQDQTERAADVFFIVYD